MRSALDIETVVPYGNPKGALHLRFVGDYLTFCGRNCDGWSKSDATFSLTISSAYACKHCLAQLYK